MTAQCEHFRTLINRIMQLAQNEKRKMNMRGILDKDVNNRTFTQKFCMSKSTAGDRLCGQSSWLQIRRPGFDSRHYQKKKVVGLERGSLSLVSTTEELLDRKAAAPV
jgi:hypothetical protein